MNSIITSIPTPFWIRTIVVTSSVTNGSRSSGSDGDEFKSAFVVTKMYFHSGEAFSVD